MDVKKLEEQLKDIRYNKPTVCDKCMGKLEYIGVGEYKCRSCQNKVLDDYGKVRRYMDEKGTASPLEISRDTGVSKDTIERLIREGTLVSAEEDEEGSRKCAGCGKSISEGRYCRECMLATMAGLGKAFGNSAPQKQADPPKGKTGARMHLDRSKYEP